MTTTTCEAHNKGRGLAEKGQLLLISSELPNADACWVGRAGTKGKGYRKGPSDPTPCSQTPSQMTMAGLEAEEAGAASALPRDHSPSGRDTASKGQDAAG